MPLSASWQRQGQHRRGRMPRPRRISSSPSLVSHSQIAPLLHMQSQPSGKQAQRLAESHTDLPVSETQKGRYRTHESVYEGQTRGQGRVLTQGGYSGRPQGDRGVPVHGHPTWHAFDWKRLCPPLPLPSSGRHVNKKLHHDQQPQSQPLPRSARLDMVEPRVLQFEQGGLMGRRGRDGLQKQAKSTGPQRPRRVSSPLC